MSDTRLADGAAGASDSSGGEPMRLSPRLYGLLLTAIILLFYGLMVFSSWSGIRGERFHDPDDLMRLQQVRDWIHVLDHCRGVDAALRRGRAGEIYNFGGRSERFNIDVTHAVLRLTGKPQTLIRHVTDRLGHDRRYAVECAKAENELSWQVTTTFEDGLAATVDWYRTHPEWVERVRSGAYRAGSSG